mgnify:FL=1
MRDINLKIAPYNFSDKQIEKIEKMISSMTLEEKIGQLFFVVGRGFDEEYLSHVTKDLHVGGIMVRPLNKDTDRAIISYVQKHSNIPLFVAANLESGGAGCCSEGTNVATNMMIGATNDPSNAYELGRICSEEANEIGVNFAFAPVSDIDYNFRNPIMNTRTFASSVKMVKECATNYILASQKNNVMCSAKHFPGDGRDERDQHLVSSINDLSCEEWDKSYGAIYESEIKAGVLAFMTGHILLPSYSKRLNPDLEDKDILPGSLSTELLNGLLREKLGFNGLILTDASTMAGFNIPYPRDYAVPYSIKAGNDMFLFCKNLDEDVMFMKRGYERNIITEERLHDALLRILATKMKIGLLDEDFSFLKREPVLRKKENLEVAKRIASDSITLVKEQKGLLPLTVKKNKRILLHVLESGGNALGYLRTEVGNQFKALLEKEGFDVTPFVSNGTYEGLQEAFESVKEKYDAIIYLANLETKSNQTTVRIEWTNPMGVNVPIYINSIPTIFISLANPYHLLDVPRVKTYINTYGMNDYTLTCLVDKLLGRDTFRGKDPVDSFCGKWDTHL